MAVQRLNLQNIIDELLRISGYESSTEAPWETDADLIRIINSYGQRLPMRAAEVVAQQLGVESGSLHFDMWRTSATLTATSGSSTVHFPTDYDHWISFYDLTNNKPVHPIEEVSRWFHEDLKEKAPGPPEYIEILDYVTNGSNFQRRGRLYPDTETGITPDIELYYWRIPAQMPGTTPTSEYPDADPKYHMLWVYGPMLELIRSSGPGYNRFLALEQQLLVQLAATARAA